MALALLLGQHKAVPERLAITANDGVPTIVSSHLDLTASILGPDNTAFDTVIGEASYLCPVSRLFAGAKVTVNATLAASSWY